MSVPALNSPEVLVATKISPHSFTVLTATMISFATVFVALRIFIRVKVLRKFQVDDGLVVFAWMTAVVHASLLLSLRTEGYLANATGVGTIRPTPAVMAEVEKWGKSGIAQIIFYFSTLWTIKLAFLMMFRTLYHSVRWLQLYWRFVLGFTCVSWAAVTGTVRYECMVPTYAANFPYCSTETNVKWNHYTLNAHTGVDVLSDLLIISIPLSALWGVQMTLQRKAALGVLFSLTVVTIIFAILRATLTVSNGLLDQVWASVLGFTEECITIIVASLAFLKTLFAAHARNRSGRSSERRGLSSSAKGPQGKGRWNLTDLISDIANMDVAEDENVGLEPLESRAPSRDRSEGLSKDPKDSSNASFGGLSKVHTRDLV